MTNTSLHQSPSFQPCQSGADTHKVSFDPDTESVSETLAIAVADLEDREQADLPILADYIDPDALDTLLQPQRGESQPQSERTLSFPYGKYEVRVHSEGLMTLCIEEDTEME